MRLEQNVMVPMRDGVRLATDLYWPDRADGDLPVILIRTPYDKRRHGEDAGDERFFAANGFVVAVQDVRGKFASEGEFVVSASDPEDGYDTLDWLAAQRWCNGRIGTYGCSYLGENQLQLARLQHPNHAAMIPKAAAGAYRPRMFGLRTGGALELMEAVHWLGTHQARTQRRVAAPDRSTRDRLRPGGVTPDGAFDRLCRTLPVQDILELADAPSADFERFVTSEPNDPWWDRLGYVSDGDVVDVPGLHLNSWYDYGVAETLAVVNLFRRDGRTETVRANQFAIISPTRHCECEKATQATIVGSRDVGDARLDYRGLYLTWFEHWLKGRRPAGLRSWPRFTLYLTGADEWRAHTEWPPADSTAVPLYLRSEGRANSAGGDGRLSSAAPDEEPHDSFVYDPGDPVPSLGGPISPVTESDANAEQGAFDQGPVEARPDVLVYSSAPLREGVEVTGPVSLVLYVSSSARDTDFTGKLVDVEPDGTAYNLQEGILRARYRAGFERSVWMKPGEVYRLEVDLGAVSNLFAPGHRIRLEVSSSNFPRFDRNLNTGGRNFDETTWQVAHNVVHHTSSHPSHLLIHTPVVLDLE
jgi:putative CocE/NonD family hydrolase